MSNLTSSTGFGTGTGNKTLLEFPDLCTLQTCDLTLANFIYIPTLAGNAIVTAVFGLCVIGQLVVGIKHKTWGYMSAIVFGLILEIIAFVARIMLNNNPFDDDAFLMYLVTCTIAPALFTAAIYLCLARIVNIYGTHLSYFKPRTYTIVFCTIDFVCLLLQAAGGAIASIADTRSLNDTGRWIMIAGLLLQVFGLAFFLLTGGFFAFSAFRERGNWNQKYITITRTFLFKSFLAGLFLATITILIRSIYRCVELWGGFEGELFVGHELTFMMLEPVMIIIAVLCLTILHPAICFQGAWHDANFNFRTKKGDSLKSRDSSDAEAQKTGEGEFQMRAT